MPPCAAYGTDLTVEHFQAPDLLVERLLSGLLVLPLLGAPASEEVLGLRPELALGCIPRNPAASSFTV